MRPDAIREGTNRPRGRTAPAGTAVRRSAVPEHGPGVFIFALLTQDPYLHVNEVLRGFATPLEASITPDMVATVDPLKQSNP